MSTKIFYPSTATTPIGTIGNTQTTATLATSTKYLTGDIKIEQTIPVDRIESKLVPTSDWQQSGEIYSQPITFSGTTSTHTMVSIACNYETQVAIYRQGVRAVYVVNDSGQFTIYSIGQKPNVDVVLQCCLSETE